MPTRSTPIGIGSQGLTSDEALDLLMQVMPEGFTDWMDVKNTSSDIYKFFISIADALIEWGYGLIATLRSEVNPATAVQKLPDFETALGLAFSRTARTGANAQRQAAIISRLRESGAFTAANVRSIIAPLLGYADPSQLEVIECDRAGLTAAHTYAGTGGSIPDNDPTGFSAVVSVADDGKVSAGGAQLTVTLTHADLSQLTVTLTGPDGTTKSWPAGTGAASSTAIRFNGLMFAGAAVGGKWTLTVVDAVSGTTGSVVSWSLFVEGIAAGQLTGGAIFTWGVYADPALVNSPDYGAASDAIARIQHAHTSGTLLLSITPYPGVTSGVNAAIPGRCIPVSATQQSR